MIRTRVIPCLLLRNGGLVKTTKFDRPRYIGDPINAVRIFNDKEADELVFLDIEATSSSAGPNFDLLSDIASEAFMPFSYGGGLDSIDQIKRLYSLGVEKVVLGCAAWEQPALIEAAARAAGSSSVVVALDVRRSLFGRFSAFVRRGRVDTKQDPVSYARDVVNRGAGEILLTSVDREGTGTGYDTELIRRVAEAVDVPVIASGGAGRLQDFRAAVDAGASGVSAGSLFVFHGRHRAVLITYANAEELKATFES
jgi:cyclase